MINSSVGNLTTYNKRKETSFIIVSQTSTKRSHKNNIHTLNRNAISQGKQNAGMHFYIEKDGALRVCIPIDETGDYCSNYNLNSVFICLEGGIDKEDKIVDNFSDDQYKTLQSVVIILNTIYKDVVLVGIDTIDNEVLTVDLEKIKQRIK